MSSSAPKVYLTEKEMRDVVPKGRRILKVDEIDRRFEFYLIGFHSPVVDEKMLSETGLRPIFWFDLAQEVVKIWNAKTSSWDLADPGTPKLAANIKTEQMVGIVEEDPDSLKSVKEKRDLRSLLDDDI